MTPAEIRQEFLGEHFQPGIGRIVFAPETRNPKPACLLLDYKGVLASDKQQPTDNAVRASSNRAYAKPKASVEERAKAWMKQHPAIYDAFVLAAFDEAAYTKRGSAKFIAECLRRRRDLLGGKPFKIPNAYVTYMALRFMAEHPKHAGLFVTTKGK